MRKSLMVCSLALAASLLVAGGPSPASAQYHDRYGRTGWYDGKGRFHAEPYANGRRYDYRGRHHDHDRGRHYGRDRGDNWSNRYDGVLVSQRGPVARYNQPNRRSDLCVNRRTGAQWRC